MILKDIHLNYSYTSYCKYLEKGSCLEFAFQSVLPHGRIIVMPSLSSCSTHWPLPLTYEVKREKYFLCFVILNSPDSIPSRKKGGIKTPKRSVGQKITAAIIQWFWKVAFTSITGGLSTESLLWFQYSLFVRMYTFTSFYWRIFFFLLSTDW